MSHGPLPNAERAVLEGSTCGAAECPSEPSDSPMLAPEREFRALEVGVGEQHLLQDLDRGLSDWHAGKLGAMQHAREAAAAIRAPGPACMRGRLDAALATFDRETA